MSIVSGVSEFMDSFLAWIGTSLKQSTSSYCDLQTADSPTVLVNHDGALLSLVRIYGVNSLIGRDEFDQIQHGLQQTLQTTMSHPGHAIQVYFCYNKEEVQAEIADMLAPAKSTANQLS